MSSEATPWKVLTLVMALLAIVASSYVAYDLHQRGSSPEKHVELSEFSPINLLAGLSGLGDKAVISVTVEGQTFNNIVIKQAYFTNKGNSPIIPSDFYNNLSVSVNTPWKQISSSKAQPSSSSWS